MIHRLKVAYRGTRYAGWQRQINALTVQQVLEEALTRVTGESVRVIGSGRTDAGVHARGQVASLELSRSWPGGALVHGVNRHLPDDVRVLAAARAGDGFDARRHARSKAYHYQLVRVEVVSPLDAWWRVQAPRELDCAGLQAAAAALVGRHDFTAFAKLGGSHSDPHRRILDARWVSEGPLLTFTVVGEGFLRGMVRALVGTMLEIGQGRRAPDSLPRLLAGATRDEAGPNAPAHGLVLDRVDYDAAESDWL